MAIQTLGLGTVADDGTGDTLRSAGDKINDNFLDVYTVLGDGTTLSTAVTTASPTFTGTIIAVNLDLSGDLTVGDDVSLDSDGAILNFGENSEISLTHVHNTGLLLNSTSVIQFNDASQNIGAPDGTTLDINATDEIELNATLVDINANLDVSGNVVIGDGATIGSASSTSAITIASTGIVTFVDDIIIKDAGTIGSASDTDSMAIASTGIVTFSQIPALPVNSIEISTTTRGAFLVIEAGGTDGAGANAGENIIDETDLDDIIHESATDLVGSVFNIIDSAGMVVRTINSV